jgi:uncharacterized SAM-binding protein YcdF (DUF218 family)
MFLVKKWVAAFSYPYALGALMVLVGFWCWGRRRERAAKSFLLGGFLLMIVPSFSFVAASLTLHLEQGYPAYGSADFLSRYPDAHAPLPVVVLGGGVHSGDLPLSAKLPPAAAMRIIEAASVVRAVPGRRLIVSGGQPYGGEPEAPAMARLAEFMGVDASLITLEAQSKDTAEQAQLIKTLLPNTPFFLVTSASHMARAMTLFRAEGLDPIPCPVGKSPEWQWGAGPGNYVPSAKAASRAEIAFHEYLGLLALWLK